MTSCLAVSGTEKDNRVLQDESRAPQSGGNGREQSTALRCVAGILCEAGLDNYDLLVTPKP